MSDIQSFSPLWGNWEIGELIGKGSYGSVYKVSRFEHGTEYVSAVKHLAIPLEPSFTQSLYTEGIISDANAEKEYYNEVLMGVLDEIRTNYKLRGNSNIVSYEDHLVVPRKEQIGYDIFIRMELLTSLSDYIQNNKQGNFSEKDVIALGCDMCDALDILERENILHRDIKTSNIFVTNAGKYKLGDFGVSRSLENSATHMSIKGTFDYMPPEIQYGNAVNHTADLYCLGLVLYRLCNGNRKPFLPPPPTNITHEENNTANQKRLHGMKLPAPSIASSALSEVILRACEYEPENRYQHAYDMKNALVFALNSLADTVIDDDRTIGVFDNPISYMPSGRTGTMSEPASAPPPPPPPKPSAPPPPPPRPAVAAPPIPEGSINPPPVYPRPAKKSKLPMIFIGLLLVVCVSLATVLALSLFNEDDASDDVSDDTAISATEPSIEPDATIAAEQEMPTRPAGAQEAPNMNFDTSSDLTAPAQPEAPEVATPTPTATATVSYEDDYLIPNSDSMYLSESDLVYFSREELCFARNEIYARHGYQFITPVIASYFASQSWYSPSSSFSTSSLNQFESYNINAISNYENTYYGGSIY